MKNTGERPEPADAAELFGGVNPYSSPNSATASPRFGFDFDRCYLWRMARWFTDRYEVCNEDGAVWLLATRHKASIEMAGNSVFGAMALLTVVSVFFENLVSASFIVPTFALLIVFWYVAAASARLRLQREIVVRTASDKAVGVMTIRNDTGDEASGRFQVLDADGMVLAILVRPPFFRRRWQILRPNGQLWCVADTRRFSQALNARVFDADGLTNLGHMKWRLFILGQRCAVDLSEDMGHSLDRRVALGLTVLLAPG